MALDDVSISPQQQAATQQIAQNVASSSGSPAPASQGSSLVGQAGNILLSAVQGFASARMGQDAVGQQLRAKYAQELQDRELANKEKLAKEQIQQQFLVQGIQNQGSAFLQNPKIKKLIGIDNLPLYEQMAKGVDQQNQISAAAAKALGLPPGAEHLPKQIFDYMSKQAQLKQQAQLAGQKNALTARGQDLRAQESANAIGAAGARTAATISAENARHAADVNERYYAVDQATARSAGTSVTPLNNSLQKLLTTYDPASGQKYSNQAAIAAAKAHNQTVDTAEAKMRKVDPNANLDNYRVKISGVDKDGNERTESHAFGLWKSSVPVTIVPWNSGGTKNTEAVKTGIESAPQSIKGRKVVRVPVSDEYPTGLKYAE